MINPCPSLWLAAAALLIAGCAALEPPSFAPGTAMGEVESRMGKPKDIVKAPDGGTVWQYPNGPVGQTTYMVDFGADQRVKSVYQALTFERFAKIVPGTTTQDDVRLLFGRPGQTMFFSRMDEEVWSYRYQIRGEQQLDLQRQLRREEPGRAEHRPGDRPALYADLQRRGGR